MIDGVLVCDFVFGMIVYVVGDDEEWVVCEEGVLVCFLLMFLIGDVCLG